MTRFKNETELIGNFINMLRRLDIKIDKKLILETLEYIKSLNLDADVLWVHYSSKFQDRGDDSFLEVYGDSSNPNMYNEFFDCLWILICVQKNLFLSESSIASAKRIINGEYKIKIHQVEKLVEKIGILSVDDVKKYINFRIKRLKK